MTQAQQAMLRAIYYMPGGVHRDTAKLANRVGTSPQGAGRTLAALDARGYVRCSVSGQWSLTDKGHETS